MNIHTNNKTEGEAITLGSNPRRTHLWCLLVFKYFPELADQIRSNELARESLDRAIAKQQIAIQSLNDAIRRRRNIANARAQNPPAARF